MAQTRGSTPEVETWVQTTMQLIEAATSYAESGQYDADTDGMIRRIRVATSALQAALQSINIMPPMTGLLPTAPAAAPEGEPLPATPQSAPAQPAPARQR